MICLWGILTILKQLHRQSDELSSKIQGDVVRPDFLTWPDWAVIQRAIMGRDVNHSSRADLVNGVGADRDLVAFLGLGGLLRRQSQ